MDTRLQLTLSDIIVKSIFLLVLLLSMRQCSVKCSDVLLPCDDSASGSGSDGSADNLCPATSTSRVTPITTLTLTNTIISEIQQSSSTLLSTSELVTTSSAIQPTSSRPMETPGSSTVLALTSTTTSMSMSSSMISVSQSMLPTSTPQPTSTTTELPMTSSPIPVTTSQIDPTDIATTLSIFDRIRQFFENLPRESLIGFGVGGLVVLILLFIICIFCCCCVHSQLKKRKRGRMDLTNHRHSLTISNPIAMVSNSNDHNEKTPARYRSTLHNSLDYSEDVVDVKNLDSDLFNFPSTEYRESVIDDVDRAYITQPSQLTHATQPSQMTQMSTATDLFRERSLPRLSPLSYSSQILTAPQFPNHCPSLSVDENDSHTALGSRHQSLMALIPNPSPSLRVPTLMARSLKNEESKSAQGSKVSMQGSRTSIQGSRPSMLGSKGSVHTGTGSRSQIYSSNPSSREHSVLLLNGARDYGVSEDDVVSLPLSGRGISPAMKQNSFEEVPTRDSPGPELASHAVSYGKKDFASLTCIPNQYAVEAERLEEKQPLSTVPEKQSTDEVKDKEANTEIKKKPRSRAMSKLEKLTSLDYIRASLRLKKKKVSFEKTPESAKKEKQKNVKENSGPETKVKGQEQATPEHAGHPSKELLQSRRHSASARAEFSPQHAQQQIPTNKYPDHYYYPQLSQPMYYGAGAPVHTAAMFYQYPQLSQQYYAQLSQGGYGGGQGGYGAGPYPPPPPHMLYQGNMMDTYSRSYGDPTAAARYQAIVTPDLFDDTPEPEFYQERNPDNILQQGQQTNGFNDPFQSPDHPNMRSSSPDRFTETSDTSSYAMHSAPPSASHTHEDSITSAHKHFMDEFAMDSTEHYGSYGGEQHHVPTYPMDMLNRTGHVPHEAYRDTYQHGDMGMGHNYDTYAQANGNHYSNYTSPTAYSAVPHGKGSGAVRRPSRSSYASSTSDHAPLEVVQEGEGQGEEADMKNGDMNGSSTKTRVSWSTEVIEYQRTPSDLADSDFDFNQF